jgi:hypothetical protein
MLRWNGPKTRGDAGRASIEFLVFAIAVFVPLVFVIQSLWLIQAAAIGTEQAARDAVRVFVQHTNTSAASDASQTIATHVAREHGITEPLRLQRSCQPTNCLAPGALVTIRATVDVTLWQVPVFSGGWPVTVPVSGHASARVSTYGGGD